MVQTLNNLKIQTSDISIVVKQRVIGFNSKSKYRPLSFQLSNGDCIEIPKGFEWDGSSVPRFLWWLLPPDGDFEIGALIHDYLYIKKRELNYTREFADKEMLLWSKALSGTNNLSLRNIDNYTRYYAVRLLGWIVWKDIIKIK